MAQRLCVGVDVGVQSLEFGLEVGAQGVVVFGHDGVDDLVCFFEQGFGVFVQDLLYFLFGAHGAVLKDEGDVVDVVSFGAGKLGCAVGDLL